MKRSVWSVYCITKLACNKRNPKIFLPNNNSWLIGVFLHTLIVIAAKASMLTSTMAQRPSVKATNNNILKVKQLSGIQLLFISWFIPVMFLLHCMKNEKAYWDWTFSTNKAVFASWKEWYTMTAMCVKLFNTFLIFNWTHFYNTNQDL